MKAKVFEKLIRKIIREEIDYALSREIRNLKEDGHTILDKWESRVNLYGQKKRFKRYFLIENDIDYARFKQEGCLLM